MTTRRAAAILALAAAAADAHAVTRVRVETLSGQTLNYSAPAGQDFALQNIDNTIFLIYIYADPPSENIGRVTLLAHPGQNTVQVVLSPNGAASGMPLDPACVHFKGLVAERDRIRFAGAITGDLQDSIIAGAVRRFDVGGRALAPITHGRSTADPTADAVPMEIYAGEIAPNAHITAQNGDIQRVQTVAALNANVVARFGYIHTIAAGGDIGSPAAVRTISARNTDPTGSFNIFELSGANIYANVSTGDPANPILRLTNLHARGSLGGNVELHGYQSITVGANLVGRIRKAFWMPAGRDIVIGGSLAPTGQIAIDDPTGLRGQIWINKNNAGGGWLPGGRVTVGATALTSASYPQLASALGGGGVGVAPFTLHPASCAPPNGSRTVVPVSRSRTAFTDCDVNNPNAGVSAAVVRFYGPVEFAPGKAEPLIVETQPLAGGPWRDVTRDFDFATNPAAEHREILVTRDPRLPRWFPVDARYRVRPADGRVRSRGVDGAPPVTTFQYTFELAADCAPGPMSAIERDPRAARAHIARWLAQPADMNDDGLICAQDLAMLLDSLRRATRLPMFPDNRE